ncbi:TldD/PmbA family protein [Methanoplanus sp. FWC-SCC4]|uniref:TldD/PmbA family protein n=1 Tax=Methanochimaera problematica TaxID=2609417 RepID=A0AA97I3R4_9EURY|nr:metallopeptidase TldD-related protein [Methanoplanus sp. FWC-SCC4]WOF16978.1 TldD/PmbA family protein [Methanoplanus sp. FWC-SCC4]
MVEKISVIDNILREGQKIADDVEVFFAKASGVGVELKGSQIGEASGSDSCGIGIRVIKDGKIGCSSTNDPLKWKMCLDSAVSGAKLATPQEWGGLPLPSEIEKRDLHTFDTSLKVDISVTTEMINKLKTGASEYEADIVGGSASVSSGGIILANSNGVFYSNEKTRAGVSLETICGTSTGYEFDNSCFQDEIDPVNVGREAAYLAVHSKDGDEIDTGKYDVILSPVAVCQLLGSVVFPSFSGKSVKAKRSFLADKLGECCMDESLSIYDDPFNGMGAALRDSEGVPTRKIDFVKEGVVNEFSYDLKTAYRYGEQSTGSAVRAGSGGAPVIGTHNIYVDGKRENIYDEKAVYAHTVVGAHTANGITGDFSVELSNASWMQDGERGRPIRSAMLSGNIFEMLKDIQGMSPESRKLGSIIVPAMRFGSLSVVGK